MNPSTSSMQSPELQIIIVTYRARDLLDRCLGSLARSPYSHSATQIDVVDNASGDGTADLVRTRFPGVRMRALSENVGFAAANNLVLRETTAPYVLLLNPDTEVFPGGLDQCVSSIKGRPEVGVLGCRLIRPSGDFDHAAKRSFPTITNALAYFARTGVRKGAASRLSSYTAPDVAENGVGYVDAVSGAFMLVRREAYAEVGLLDEGYWMYGEDLDWCYRFHEKGWRVIYDGRITVMHVKGGSSGRYRTARTNAAFHQAMARFYRKYHAPRRPWLSPVVYAGIGTRFVGSSLHSAARRRLAAAWPR